MSRDILGGKIVPKFLLVRRIAMFLLSRFKYKPQPDVTYLDGFDPENVGKTLFGGWASFHHAYPAGMSMDQVVEDKTSPVVATLAFLTKLAPSQTHMLELIANLMSCQGDVDAIVAHSVSQDPVMSADSFSRGTLAWRTTASSTSPI